jgi:hypothetical protein
MSDTNPRRPRTMHEVATQAQSYREFGMNLKDFLHEVAYAKQQGRLLEPLFAEEPPSLDGRLAEGKICDAYLAATADYLSRKNRILTPTWALSESRVLEEPWFSVEALEVRLYLLRDSPSAFKDKNIFTMESALNVA